MRSATNVNDGGGRKTPLAGLAKETPPMPPAQQAHLASRGIEGRYSAFYKAQLRVAVLDDYASFSGGVHKYADHIVRSVMAEHGREPIDGFQEAWLSSPDDASHPFHGRNLRNFFAGKDSAYAVWAVLDLYIKLTKPKLAQGFKLDGYLERLGLTMGEFAQAETFSDQEIERLYTIGTENDDGSEEFLFIQPLPGRRYGVARLIRRFGAPVEAEDVTVPEGLDDSRTASGVGVILPLSTGAVVLLKDPDTEALNFGRLAPDEAAITLSTPTDTNMHILKQAEPATLSRDLLTNWMGDTQ